MGGTLTQTQKEPYCHIMTTLYIYDSPYWHPSLDLLNVISSTVFLAIAFQIIRHKHL